MQISTIVSGCLVLSAHPRDLSPTTTIGRLPRASEPRPVRVGTGHHSRTSLHSSRLPAAAAGSIGRRDLRPRPACEKSDAFPLLTLACRGVTPRGTVVPARHGEDSDVQRERAAAAGGAARLAAPPPRRPRRRHHLLPGPTNC